MYHVTQQDTLNALTLGSVKFDYTTTCATNFLTMAPKQPGIASMLDDFFTTDLGKCSMGHLMAYGAFARMVAAEFEDYGISVPEELTKRQKLLGREIARAIERQIEALEAEEKELQKREEKREVLRQKREKLQQALR